MQFETHPYGHFLKLNKSLIFFGNHLSQIENLKSAFPNLDFRFLSQYHSDQVVMATNETLRADGHWTFESNVAVGVYTADCIPVLIADSEGRACLAIHAGWRGVANSIVIKGIRTFQQQLPNAKLNVFIGPHIMQESFEVDEDVAQVLLTVYESLAGNQSVSEKIGVKTRVNLCDIVLLQLNHCQIPTKNIFSFLKNTAIDPDYFSYRRGKKSNERQISFIACIT